MVYINSRGEVLSSSTSSPVGFFWKVVEFIVMFFKSLVGIETRPDKKDEGRIGSSGPISGKFNGSGGPGGGGGGGFGSKPKDNPGPRGFGPRGFKSVTDLSPPPTPMMGCSSGGCCG